LEVRRGERGERGGRDGAQWKYKGDGDIEEEQKEHKKKIRKIEERQ
jgi:hypothetical protein